MLGAEDMAVKEASMIPTLRVALRAPERHDETKQSNKLKKKKVINNKRA